MKFLSETVKWAQRNNKQSNHPTKEKLLLGGNEYDSLEGAAKAFGKSRNTVDYRLSRGWPPEQAVGFATLPSFASKNAGIPIQVKGNKFKTLKEAAKHYQRAHTHVIESCRSLVAKWLSKIKSSIHYFTSSFGFAGRKEKGFASSKLPTAFPE